MVRTMNFFLDMPGHVELEGNLRMILWAGDCVHNDVTDVERLPDFDVYLCYGSMPTLQANIDYIYNRSNPGIICILDAMNKYHMARFIELFRNRFNLIDSDFNCPQAAKTSSPLVFLMVAIIFCCLRIF